MKLKKLKLNALSEAGLKDKEMNAMKGGYLGCRCSCYWADQGGSSSDDNMGANYTKGDGAHSTEGCNQYWAVGSGVFDGPDCNESNNCG